MEQCGASDCKTAQTTKAPSTAVSGYRPKKFFNDTTKKTSQQKKVQAKSRISFIPQVRMSLGNNDINDLALCGVDTEL